MVTICARGGSKGIPGKNIKMLNGKPLISYSIAVAEKLAEKYSLDIYLSTDSDEIKRVVENLAYPSIDTSYTRPDFLADDSAGKLDAITDVFNYATAHQKASYDFVIDLDVTSPLRTPEDLDTAVQLLFKNTDALNIFSVSPANRNPYFNMVEKKSDGFVELCKSGTFLTRQSAPKVFDMNASFYVFKNEFFSCRQHSVITNKSIVYEVPHLCFDLDHQIDFDFMSFLLENHKLDFDFLY